MEFEAQFKSLELQDKTKNSSVAHKRTYKTFIHGKIGMLKTTRTGQNDKTFLEYISKK